MTITPLEKTLIDQARAHQKELAAYYPKHHAGPFNEENHADYLKHSGALTSLLELAHFKSGLSDQATEQLRQIEVEDAATFKLHFSVHTASSNEGFAKPSTHGDLQQSL